MAFQVTPAHQDIFDAIVANERNLQIQAVAGSGKTTTIVKALEMVPSDERVLFLAFNKSIANELGDRVPYHCEARTLNSLGHRAVTSHLLAEEIIRNRRQLTLDSDKMRNLMFDMEDAGEIDSDTVKFIGFKALQMARLAKGYGVIPDSSEGLQPDDDAFWWHIIDHHDLDVEVRQFGRIAGLARELLRKSLANLTTIDFDDQLYLPFVLDMDIQKFDRVFVDEAQDLSPLQHDLLARTLRPSSQLVAVGDPNQAIYGFRGADSNSMQTLQKRFDTLALPLHVSYRCPSLVVKEAQKDVPHIKAPDGAPDGIVDQKTKSPEDIDWKGGDLVVCRTTAPVVALAYDLIRQNIRAEVLGRQIGKGLVKLLKKLKVRSVDDLPAALRAWEKKETEKARKRRAPEATLHRIHSKVECLTVLSEDATSISAMISTITDLFIGDRDSNKVTLCTVHKAKGLEADRVFILNRHLMPHPMAKKPWQVKQEHNLRYVAVTRAKKELRFITTGDR